jgi:hypothetical protein
MEKNKQVAINNTKMIAQDLSSRELKTCALLYSTTNSILFTPSDILERALLEHSVSSLFNKVKLQGDTFIRTWYGRSVYTAPEETIQSLQDRKLLIMHKEQSQKFYVLNRHKKFNKFFKELEVQIALGSI